MPSIIRPTALGPGDLIVVAALASRMEDEMRDMDDHGAAEVELPPPLGIRAAVDEDARTIELLEGGVR